MNDNVIARLDPSPARRYAAVGFLWVLGGLLLALALGDAPAGAAGRVLLVLAGAAALALGAGVLRATSEAIELTEAGALRTTSGILLAPAGGIARVDRGLFAFKPSNGFLITLEARPEGRFAQWAPGLWWRVGKRLGVGGVTSAAAAKAMADTLSAMLMKGQAGR